MINNLIVVHDINTQCSVWSWYFPNWIL